MERALAALVCMVWILLSVPSQAWAAPGTPVQRAEAATKEGAALEKAGKPEDALAKYEEAYAIVSTGMAAYYVARAEASLGRHKLALQHYREALRDTKLPTDVRRDAETAVEELKTKVGILVLDVPDSATTTVDTREVDARQPVEVAPGAHVVKIRLGGESKSTDVTATAGAVTQVKLRFGTEGPLVGAGPGPGPSSSSPSAPATAPLGSSGGKWPLPKLVTVGAGGVVAAGLLTASLVVFATANDDKNADAGLCARTPSAPDCAELADRRDSYDGARTTSTIFFYSGLVIGALAASAAVLWPNERVAVTSSRGASALSFRF